MNNIGFTPTIFLPICVCMCVRMCVCVHAQTHMSAHVFVYKYWHIHSCVSSFSFLTCINLYFQDVFCIHIGLRLHVRMISRRWPRFISFSRAVFVHINQNLRVLQHPTNSSSITTVTRTFCQVSHVLLLFYFDFLSICFFLKETNW